MHPVTCCKAETPPSLVDTRPEASARLTLKKNAFNRVSGHRRPVSSFKGVIILQSMVKMFLGRMQKNVRVCESYKGDFVSLLRTVVKRYLTVSGS